MFFAFLVYFLIILIGPTIAMSRPSRNKMIESKFSGCIRTIERTNPLDYFVVMSLNVFALRGRVTELAYIAYEFKTS